MNRDEYDLPLTVKRTRCASPDIMEFRLMLGTEMLAFIFTSSQTSNAVATARLLSQLRLT